MNFLEEIKVFYSNKLYKEYFIEILYKGYKVMYKIIFWILFL